MMQQIPGSTVRFASPGNANPLGSAQSMHAAREIAIQLGRLDSIIRELGGNIATFASQLQPITAALPINGRTPTASLPPTSTSIGAQIASLHDMLSDMNVNIVDLSESVQI